MRISMILAGAAVTALALAASNPGTAEAKGAEADAGSSQAATLLDKPRLAADIEAMPRIQGDSPATTHINAELDRLDAQATTDAAGCAADAGDGPGGGWSRAITRPMTGPAYVTLREHLDIYCGGPYPSMSQTSVTYDLSAGSRVDWTVAIPGLGLTLGTFDDMPRDYVALVSSPALGAWFSSKMLAVPDAEWVERCRFDPEQLAEQGFNIWADAKNGGVTVQPDFPHVIQACAESATLTPEDLRGFDAAPALVEAITAAHASGNWAPKED